MSAELDLGTEERHLARSGPSFKGLLDTSWRDPGLSAGKRFRHHRHKVASHQMGLGDLSESQLISRRQRSVLLEKDGCFGG